MPEDRKETGQINIIISAFPGTGKSYMCKEQSHLLAEHLDGEVYSFELHDSDSSKFSWIYDDQGNKTDQRNPDFPKNYISHITEIMESEGNHIIFVSSHDTVRQALVAAGLEFYLVIPQQAARDDYIKRYEERENDAAFINSIKRNWDERISEYVKFAYKHGGVTLYCISSYISNNINGIIANEIRKIRERKAISNESLS